MITRYFNIDYELSPSEARQAIDERIASGKAGYICVADGNILTMVHRDMAYREVVNGSMFSICDSSWVPMYLNALYGFRPEQYCGSQIFKDLTEMQRYRQLFLGASQQVLDALRCEMMKVDPAIGEMTFMELPFRKVEEFDYESIAKAINAVSPDVVWLALGAPKQEQFAARLVPHLDGGVVIPVGAVFNFRAGLGINRAPEWMLKCHLEWLYRIFSEPKKQLRRVWNILVTLPAIFFEESKRKSHERH